MNKLDKKVFWTITLILTLFLFTILIIFNTQNYFKEKRNIEEKLNMLDKTPNDFKRLDNNDITGNINNNVKEKDFDYKEEPKFFMDTVIYTIELDENNNIKNIISHNQTSDIDTINEYATKLLESKKIKKLNIGNLYINNYSYKYSAFNNIVVIDNTSTNTILRNYLRSSIIIFILLEIIIILVSKLLTKWIIKPVQESFDRQKQFIADASHELKTPIAVIMSNLEAYEIDKKKKWLDNISSEAERMNNLIKRLLDLAKLEKTNTTYTSNNLSKIVEKQTLTFESIMYEKNIELESNITNDLYINSNQDELKQVVSIILDNAIKHSFEENGSIKVTLKKKNSKIILEISNKGNPIPKGEEEKIFERFYRVDEARNRGENRYGLGLAIAKSIVIKHNGVIKAFSNNGYTTFQITFKK